MKLKQTIVNEKRQLIGFFAEGKASEFGGIGTENVVNTVSLSELFASNFRNSQIEIVPGKSNKKIVCKGSFQLNRLPMQMYAGGKFSPVDNTLTLISRITHDGELVGFEFINNGIKYKDTTQNIVRLASWHNTGNFVVRHLQSGLAIAGRSGQSLDKLPIIPLYGSAPEKENKKTTRTIQKGMDSYNNVRPYEFLALCEEVNSLGGKIVLLPGTVYKRTSELTTETSPEFRKTGVEISSAVLEGGEKSLNASLPFKQIGQLIVNVGGTDKTYYPYTFKKKNVYQNGEMHTPFLGMAILKTGVPVLQEKFGKSLALAVITDMMTNMYIKNFLQVRNPDDYVLLSINTDKLSLMTKETAVKYQLDDLALCKIAKEKITAKIVTSYVNSLMKGAKDYIESHGNKLPRPLYGAYSVCSEIELQALRDAGIDVFNGSYTKTQEKTEVELKSGASTVEKETDISAEYGIKGMKGATVKYTDFEKKPDLISKYPTEYKIMTDIKNKCSELKSVEEIYKYTEQVYIEWSRNKDNLTDTVWKHNLACLTLGNLTAYKFKNPANWEVGKALKDGQTFICRTAGAEDLVLNLKGIKASAE